MDTCVDFSANTAKSVIDFILPVLQSEKRRRVVTVAMLALLHLTLFEGPVTPVGRTLFVVHLGLFFLWQPFMGATDPVSRIHALVLTAVLAMAMLATSWWFFVVWLILLASILGGKVFMHGRTEARVFHLLALGYLVAELLVYAVPHILRPLPTMPLPQEILAVWVLPIALLVMMVLPGEPAREDRAEVIDFAYSVILLLLLSVIVLGAIALMSLEQIDYGVALAEVLTIISTTLFFLSWVWDPKEQFSGLSAITSRYLLSIGVPFEHWVRGLSSIARHGDEPGPFLTQAGEDLVRRVPWLAGGQWFAGDASGSFGRLEGSATRFEAEQVSFILYSRFPMAPSLYWHYDMVTHLLQELYVGRERSYRLQEMSYMRAIHETGARLTHDVKNLLQSLNTLCAAAGRELGEPVSPQYLALVQRQLPVIAQRLQLTLEKLRRPEMEGADWVVSDQWWQGLQLRYGQEGVSFVLQGDLEGASLPGSLFTRAAENFLQNALDKRRLEPGMAISLQLKRQARGISLRAIDTGSPVPMDIARDFGKRPLATEAGLGIAVYQVARHAELLGFRVALAENQPGRVVVALEPGD